MVGGAPKGKSARGHERHPVAPRDPSAMAMKFHHVLNFPRFWEQNQSQALAPAYKQFTLP